MTWLLGRVLTMKGGGRLLMRRFYRPKIDDSSTDTSIVRSSKNRNTIDKGDQKKKRTEAVIDLFKMDERQFENRKLRMPDEEWLPLQRALARTDAYEPVSLRTLEWSANRAVEWLRKHGSRLSADEFAENLLVQAKYFRAFQQNRSNNTRGALYCHWLSSNLKRLTSEQFFTVIASFEKMPAIPGGEGLFSDDIVKMIGEKGREFSAEAKSSQLSSLFRTIRLHCPSIDAVSRGTSALFWTELSRKGLPTDADDLFLTLKSLTEPIALSLSQKGAKEFPFRPSRERQFWFRQLIAAPFSKKRFANSRPLSLIAAVGLLGKSSGGPLVPFTNDELLSFTLQTAQPYRRDLSIIFEEDNHILFGKILDAFRTLAWSTDSQQIVHVREKLLQQNVAFNEQFWKDFWLCMDRESRTLPLHGIIRLRDLINLNTRINHQEAEKLLTNPFPATSFAWIDHCLDRSKEIPHPDNLFHAILYSWSDTTPNSTKQRLLEFGQSLDPLNPAKKQKWIQQMDALEKSINQADNSGTTTTVERLRDATKILQSDKNRLCEIDFPLLHQSMGRYIPDFNQSTVARDFMTALLSRPEAVEHISQPQNWLFMCNRLYMGGDKRMRPGVEWWQALCMNLQKNEPFPDKHAYRFLASYLKLKLVYPDYPLPAVLFDCLERKIASETDPAEVIAHLHHLHLIRLRDEALVHLAEERLFVLTETGGRLLNAEAYIGFLLATTSLSIAVRRNWWKQLDDDISQKAVPLKPVTLYILLNTAIMHELLFAKGSVPPTLIGWALKKLIAEWKISYDELHDATYLHRVRLVFGDKAIASAHPNLLTYIKENAPRRLSSDTSATLVYVEEADVWCYSVDHQRKCCQIIRPAKCYWKRDGTRDRSVLFVDFAASVALLKAAGFDVHFVDGRGRPLLDRSKKRH